MKQIQGYIILKILNWKIKWLLLHSLRFFYQSKRKEDLKETADKQNSLTKFLYEVAIEELDEVEEKSKLQLYRQ